MDQKLIIEMSGKISAASFEDEIKTINGPLGGENQNEMQRYVEMVPCNRGSVINDENLLQNITKDIKELHVETSKRAIPQEKRVAFEQLQNRERNMPHKRKQSELNEDMKINVETFKGKLSEYSKNNSMVNSKTIKVLRQKVVQKAEIHKPKQNDQNKNEMIPKIFNEILNSEIEVLETSVEKRSKIPMTVDTSAKLSVEPSLSLEPNEAELKKKAKVVPELFSLLPPYYSTNTKNAHYFFLAAEYELDIYNYLFALERKISIRANHLDKQLEITSYMRSTLIDWINEVSSAFYLTIETFLYSVGILDRYMQLDNNVKREEYQLVGVTAMCLASKYEEIMPPALADWIYISDKTYTDEQIMEMEKRIFSKIGYNLSYPIAIKFLRRLSKVANINKLLYRTAKYLMELSTISYELASVEPSRIAAASLFLVMHLFSINANSKTNFSNELWTTELGWNSRYTAEALHTTCKNLAKQALMVPGSRYQAIYKKYKTSKLDYIAANPLLYGKFMKSIAAIQES